MSLMSSGLGRGLEFVGRDLGELAAEVATEEIGVSRGVAEEEVEAMMISG